MSFVIKSLHSPGLGLPNRVFFWQTLWILWDNTAQEWYETGAWQSTSIQATLYKTEEEANNVNAMGYLSGRVEPLRLTPSTY